MRIVLNGYHVNLQEGDDVCVSQHECGKCGRHTEIEVRRDHERVAHFGDEVRLFDDNGEIFGDVVVPEEK